jgi:hypothetical protein
VAVKNHWRRIRIGLLVTLGCATLGYFVGAKMNQLALSDAFVHWQALGSPPGGADQFVAADIGIQTDAVDLSVRSASGETYVYRGAKGGVWELTTEPAGQAPYDCAESFTKNRDPSYDLLPGEPVRCGSIVWSWEWTTDTDLFVILEDGSVWRWHVRHGISDAILWQCGLPLVFVAVGWVVYLGVWLIFHRAH